MRKWMQQIERTTQNKPQRETSPSQEPSDIEARVTITKQTKEVHIYTYPGPDAHYQKSDLNQDIEENPALYWGNAKF